MFRTIAAATLSAAVAFSPMAATPAQADNSRDLVAILAGAATLIIIGAAVSRDRRSKTPPPAVHVPPKPPVYPRPSPPKPVYPHHNKTVDSRCLRSVQTRSGWQNLFLRSCLQRTMNISRLPGQCSTRVHGKGNGLEGYDPRCLRNHGWRQV